MNRRPARALAALAVLAVLATGLVIFVKPWGGPAATTEVGRLADPPLPTPSDAVAGEAPPAMPRVAFDDDPAGALVLEGQVIDENEDAVAGAIVQLSSAPPRTATSEADGSFSFDRLVGKTYYLSARADALIGGPVRHALTLASAPVVVRMRPGAVVAVEVVSEASGAPIAAAAVVLGGGEQVAVTAADGRVRFRGAPTGWTTVTARAPGHAERRQLVEIPDSPGVEVGVRLALRGGARVSGVVVDSSGTPVVRAKVIARDAAELIPLTDPRSDGADTDEQGRFVLAAVPAGTQRFVAHHGDHPQAASEALATDGVTELGGVRIQFASAAVLAGRVVDASARPVPWAAVRVASKSRTSALDGEGTRETVADGDGRFTMKGLARESVQVVARAEGASSQVVDVDLERPPAELTLVVDVAGQIAGIVVDGRGEPIADIQVTALPDFFSGGGGDFAVRGVATATSDGGGRFAVRGLPDGKYLLAVGRAGFAGNPFARKTTKAKVGDTGVRLVLEADGALKGRVLYADGSAPTTFTVAIGQPPGVPVASKDGTFSIPAVAPGRYDVTVRGIDFAEVSVKDVVVPPGAEKDLGTVSVKRGRTVRGRVLDGSQQPVGGAQVAIASQLIGDGKSLVADIGSGSDESTGLRRATSDEDGRYLIRGIGEAKPLIIAADHPRAGRSVAVEIAQGGDSPTVDLVLGPVGAVKGKVVMGGKPASAVTVFATPIDRSEMNTVVTTGADGSYQIDRLAAGVYQVSAMAGAGMSANMVGKQVTVRGGRTEKVDIVVEVGEVTLTVAVTGVGNAPIDAAQVFLFKGDVSLASAGELQKTFVAASASGARMAFAMGGASAVFDKVVAGPHSACMIPINGDMSDPQFLQRLQAAVNVLKVYCRPLKVLPSPAEQKASFAIPPMDPLPE